MAIIAPAPEELNLGQVENEEVLTLLECPVCCFLFCVMVGSSGQGFFGFLRLFLVEVFGLAFLRCLVRAGSGAVFLPCWHRDYGLAQKPCLMGIYSWVQR